MGDHRLPTGALSGPGTIGMKVESMCRSFAQ